MMSSILQKIGGVPSRQRPTLWTLSWSSRMGVDADPRAEPKLDCPENELLKFSGPLDADSLDGAVGAFL